MSLVIPSPGLYEAEVKLDERIYYSVCRVLLFSANGFAAQKKPALNQLLKASGELAARLDFEEVNDLFARKTVSPASKKLDDFDMAYTKESDLEQCPT